MIVKSFNNYSGTGNDIGNKRWAHLLFEMNESEIDDEAFTVLNLELLELVNIY